MYEAFKKLRPGVPLRSLHGKMKQFKRMAVFYDFCEVQWLVQAMRFRGFPGSTVLENVLPVVQVCCIALLLQAGAHGDHMGGGNMAHGDTW